MVTQAERNRIESPLSYFESTAGFRREHAALESYIAASKIGIWTIRWQIRGYISEHLAATTEDLQDYFLRGSGLKKFDFKYFEGEQATQEREIARVGLISLLALYERWLASIRISTTQLEDGLSPHDLAQSKHPRNGQRESNHHSHCAEGLLRHFAAITQGHMTASYGSSLKKGAHYQPRNLGAMLAYFYAYKLLRNTYVHKSLLPSPSLINSFQVANEVQFTSGTRLRGVTKLPILSSDREPDFLLEHLWFAFHIVRTLVMTIDAELATTQLGHTELLARLRESGHKKFPPGTSPSKRGNQVASHVASVGLPKPVNGAALIEILENESLVSW